MATTHPTLTTAATLTIPLGLTLSLPVHATDLDWKQYPGNDHWYAIVEGPVTWGEAQAIAANQDAYLATVTSAEEDNWLQSTFGVGALNSNYWFGLEREPTPGEWRWVTSEPLDYTNWNPNYPSPPWLPSTPEHRGIYNDDGTWIHRNGFDRSVAAGGFPWNAVIERESLPVPTRSAFYESFELGTPGTYPDGWSVRFGANRQNISQNLASQGTQSAKMDALAFGAVESFVSIPQLRTPFTLSYDLYLDSASNDKGDLYVRYESEDFTVTGGFLRTDDGDFTLSISSVGDTGIVLSQDRWYGLKMRVDPAKGMVDYYLDNELIAHNSPIGGSSRPSRIVIHAGNIDDSSLTGYIDNIALNLDRVLPDGVIAGYYFDGNYTDAGPNGLDGTPTAEMQLVPSMPGKGEAASFTDRSTTRIALGQQDEFDQMGNQFTTAFWINPTHWGIIQDHDIIGSSNRDWVTVIESTGVLRFSINNVGYDSNTAILNDGWHHVAFRRDQAAGTLEIFIDGVLDAVYTGIFNDLTASTAMNIGPWELGSPSNFDTGFLGELDEMFFSSELLSDSEIRRLADAPGDANADGFVDMQDLSILAQNFGGLTPAQAWGGDFNASGDVDLIDLSILAQFFGFGLPQAATVPEPASLSLLALCALLTRRR
ncbi:LamG-like jellyroll fold domain-containing protein [Mucisphaera sp.]|uniref:LamG-like jellyroll fold domain-containing protein n=1 Tax=Mucisphaera sp. TaxID=2913024 RepID=UPI003D0D722E